MKFIEIISYFMNQNITVINRLKCWNYLHMLLLEELSLNIVGKV